MDRTRSRVGDRTHETPHAHVLGGEAPGLPGVAECLARGGTEVTGPWAHRPDGFGLVPVAGGFSRPWKRRTRLLVHGPEVGRVHPARLGALRRGIRQQTPAVWLAGELTGRLGVAFAGGREASAAAAMTGLILARAGHDPSVILDTPAPQLGGRARVGLGAAFVAHWPGSVEGLGGARPALVAVLGVGIAAQADPLRWAAAVARVAQAAGDERAVLIVGHPAAWPPGWPAAAVEWLSLRQGADWWATDLREDSGRFRFRIFHRGRYVIEVRLRPRGLGAVVAALAAAAACDRLGVAIGAVRNGLEEFEGLARDFQTRGTYRGVTLIDDEAADPGGVFDAVALARRTYRGRRLWAVLAAPDDSAPRRLLPALCLADRVTLTPLAPGPAGDGRAAAVLGDALEATGVRVYRAPGLAEAISDLDRRLEPGDVLLTLGAGDVGTIADAFIRRLPRDRPG